MSEDIYNEKFMRLALKNALKAYFSDEVPVGCVIVKGSKVICQTYNNKNSKKCVTGHAEILAIQEASEKLKRWILDDCTMYVTLEPCLMCIGAIYQCRMKKIYIGATDKNMGAVISKIPVIKDEMIYPNRVDYAFKKTISPYILKRFFRKIRKNR